MQIKGLSGQAVKLPEATLGEAPESLDAVDVYTVSFREFIGSMVDPQVLVIPHIHQAVVPTPHGQESRPGGFASSHQG